jgi:hypothetical protein
MTFGIVCGLIDRLVDRPVGTASNNGHPDVAT